MAGCKPAAWIQSRKRSNLKPWQPRRAGSGPPHKNCYMAILCSASAFHPLRHCRHPPRSGASPSRDYAWSRQAECRAGRGGVCRALRSISLMCYGGCSLPGFLSCSFRSSFASSQFRLLLPRSPWKRFKERSGVPYRRTRLWNTGTKETSNKHNHPRQLKKRR